MSSHTCLCRDMISTDSSRITAVTWSSVAMTSGQTCLPEQSSSVRKKLRMPMPLPSHFLQIKKERKWVRQQAALYGLILRRLHHTTSTSIGEMLTTQMLSSALSSLPLFLLRRFRRWRSGKAQSLIRLRRDLHTHSQSLFTERKRLTRQIQLQRLYL